MPVRRIDGLLEISRAINEAADGCSRVIKRRCLRERKIVARRPAARFGPVYRSGFDLVAP